MERNVGCRQVEVTDTGRFPVLPMAMLYPTLAPAAPMRFGPYPLEAARDAPPSGEHLSLVLVSHGSGGSPWTFRHLAASLALAGYVVGLPEHLGNCRTVDSLAGSFMNLENRPRQLRRATDAAFADPVLGPRLLPEQVAVIGHSIGAYTALAIAGGRPVAGPHDTDEGRPVPVEPDPRVQGLVLLAPATPWFLQEGSLAAVRVPILLRTGEQDRITPAWHAGLILRDAEDPGRIEHRVVPGAGHFSFMSPFPPELNRPGFPPAQDPEGFDRAGYQLILATDILRFLGKRCFGR
ncbi:alpha/beta hydrolase family protein [Geminicoccus flavidas]|uniref:alpha/beta hydrolase family protein n=1 Tax=Geminicoccus flavidas TaxID=2506407 RepID=UPI0013599626|nr:alpha/beta fold hydrolase [Geminicoccus flavidas]